MSDFGTVQKESLSDQIAERIKQMIREDKLRPGDKLPPERELAATMGVGRPVLREALRALSLMNIIEIHQGAGTFVTELETTKLLEHLEFVFSIDDSSILDLFETRKVIESGIAELAAQRISDAEIAILESALEEAVQVKEDPAAFLNADHEFHLWIVSIADNPILLRFMESIYQLGLASRTRTGHLDGVIPQSVDDLQQIFAALRDRDPLAARKAMWQHLENVESRLKGMLTDEQR